MSGLQMFSLLEESITSLDIEGVKKATQDALDQGLSPQDIISQGLAKGMGVIGERFERRDCFLPELMTSAEAMKSALAILRPHLISSGAKPGAKILLGTVQGDIHDVGKNILAAVLEGEGFQVWDLGVDVPPEEFASRAKELKPDVIGISALVSVAVSKMTETIMCLKENSIPAKVIIGGAATSQQTAETIGADAYGKDAWEGLQEIERLVKGSA